MVSLLNLTVLCTLIGYLSSIRLTHVLIPGKVPSSHVAGRLILVNSVLTVMPLYFMSYFILPKWVLMRIDRMHRSFFWKGNNWVNGSSGLISWDVCCRPRNAGGLDVINLRLFNIALLSKWWWKLLTAPQSPWVALILHFHYPHYDHLQAIHHTIHSASPFWKGVQKTSNIFLLGLGYICGEGNHICFWLDHRFGALPLAQQYQNLFRLVADQNSSIASNRYNTEWAPYFKIFYLMKVCFNLRLCFRTFTTQTFPPGPINQPGTFIILLSLRSTPSTSSLPPRQHHYPRLSSFGHSKWPSKLELICG